MEILVTRVTPGDLRSSPEGPGHGGPEGNDLIGIEAAVRRLAQQLRDAVDDGRHARSAPHQDHLVNVFAGEPGIPKHPANRQIDAIENVLGPGFQLLARDRRLGGRVVVFPFGIRDAKCKAVLPGEAALGPLALLDHARHHARGL